MSGPGRQAYHGKPPSPLFSLGVMKLAMELMEGVPRIMEGSLPSHFSIQDEDSDSEVGKAVKGYIASGRVNINARQVFPPGFKRS
jgi:hypothetical protein